MAKTNNLGEFEILVLAAILRVPEDAYGVRLREEIETRTGRSVSVGAMYTTLYRLEEKGYVTSRTGEKSPVRGGRSKRFFKITARGRKVLQQSLTALAHMTKGLLAHGRST